MLMPKVSSVYATRFLQASELSLDIPRAVMISGVVEELYGSDLTPKIVVTVTDEDGWSKDIPLNKTNARRLAVSFGDDTDFWIGQQAEVWAEDVLFEGRPTIGVRIGPRTPASAPAAPDSAAPTAPAKIPARVPARVDATLDDEIPF
jgi:hypothetical protein